MKDSRLLIFFTVVSMFVTACGAPAIAQTPEVSVSEQTSGTETEEVVTEASNEPETEVLVDYEPAPLDEVELDPPHRTNGENGERQTYLANGEPAPFAGLLLNPEAIAFIVSEWEAYQLRATAALRLQRESDMNRLRLEVGRLHLRLQTVEREREVAIEGLQRENQRLIQIHEDYIEEQTGGFWNTDFGQVLQYGLIVISSVAIGAVVGYVASALQ